MQTLIPWRHVTSFHHVHGAPAYLAAHILNLLIQDLLDAACKCVTESISSTFNK